MIRLLYFIEILISLAGVWWFIRNDAAEYAAFKLLVRSEDRRRCYLVWTLKSLCLFSGLTLFGLAIPGRLRAVVVLPAEFRALAQWLQPMFRVSPSLQAGLLAGVCCGVLATAVLGAIVARNGKKPALFAGDVEPLLPRNGVEAAYAGLMSINAGVSEELFFRLFLPLLFLSLFGHAPACFVAASVVFGVCHWYQGPAGVAATTLLGLALAAAYLGTGSLWAVMAGHAGLDLFNLVVRPSLQKALNAAVARC